MTQGSKSYLDDMLNMHKDPEPDHPKFSKIIPFFAGTNVFVTGCTGFLGKLLVEKLLRCCPDIGTLFLMVRPKKGNSPEERIQKLFADCIYKRLKLERPNFESNIVMIEGDTSRENLGLSDESKKALLSTNVIFHAAATVRFDETLRAATHVNVRGTKELLAFAREMPNLKAFVYISTAFSHCPSKFIEEKFYDPPYEPEKLLNLVEILDDEKLEVLKTPLIGEWPNTYAFSKAVTEDLVRRYSVGIPTCIVRPSIMTPTAAEPVPGWIDNLYGPTGVVLGAALGLLHCLQADPNKVADIIPADLVISTIIAAAWDTGSRGKIPAAIADSSSSSKISDVERVPIYNIVSSCDNPVRWGEYMKHNSDQGLRVPTEKGVWIYFLILYQQYWYGLVLRVAFHYIPAAIVDTILFLTGRKPMLWKTYKKIDKFCAVISFFSTQEWVFKNETTLMLQSKMNSADQLIFDTNMSNLDWQMYLYSNVEGIRVYLVNDPIENVEAGMKKYYKMRIAHYTIVTLVLLLIFWLVKTFLSFLWSWSSLGY